MLLTETLQICSSFFHSVADSDDVIAIRHKMRAHFEQELQLLDRSLQGKVAQTAEARDTVKSDYLRLRAFEKLLVHDLLKEKEASEKVGNLLILLVKPSK